METKVISNSAPSTKSELSLTSRLSTSYSCKTKGVVNEINFKWTIERSAFFGDFGIWETLKSAEFSDCKFFLTLDMTSSETYVTVYLYRDSNSTQYPLRVEIAVFNEKSEELFKQSTNAIRKGAVVGSILCFKKKYLLEYKDFVNGNITIDCKIESLTRKQLGHLKTRCETDLLISLICAKRCLDLLTLTTHHPTEHQKEIAIEYFRRCPGEVMGTDNWKKMKEENPALLCDLMQMVFTPPTD